MNSRFDANTYTRSNLQWICIIVIKCYMFTKPTYLNLHFNIMLKILLSHFLPVTLMHTPNLSGPVEILLLKALEIENLFTSLGLSQIISEPTNFERNKKLSCIDLIITDQPNLILDCGTLASLDP